MPRRKQPPESPRRFQQVHQVLVKVTLHPLPIRPAAQRLHIDNVVTHQQISPRPCGDRADAKRRHARPDDVRRPSDRESCRPPRLSRLQLREDVMQPRIVGNRVAQKSAALDGHRIRSANNFHPQTRIVAQLQALSGSRRGSYALQYAVTPAPCCCCLRGSEKSARADGSVCHA